MAGMKRRSIALTAAQVEFLGWESDRLGITEADLIRRIIDQHAEFRDTQDTAWLTNEIETHIAKLLNKEESR